jgi:PAS domain S-box-containing protein
MDQPGEIDSAALLHTLEDVFLAFDADGTIEFWNQATLDVTGYSESELEELSPVDLFHDEDAERVAAAVAGPIEDERTVVEADLVTAAGERIPYEFTTNRLPEDSPFAFTGVGRDLTDRKETEQQRKATLDRMGDGFVMVDADWRVTHANSTGEQILAEAMERDPEETAFEGLHLWEEIPDAVETRFYDQYHRAMDTGEPVSFEEYFEPMDTWFDVRAFPSEAGLSIYLYDITDSHRRREQLEHREQVLRDLYEITADCDSSFTEQVERLLALGRSELDTAYGSLSRIDGSDYRFEVVDAADDSISAGDVVPVEATNCERVASRQERLVLGDVARDAPAQTDRTGYTEWGINCYLGSPVFDNDGVYGTFCFYDTESRAGNFSSWEVTLVDLMSRWVSYERQREQITEELHQQNDRLEQFASLVSHDLRNPLGTASGHLELAREEYDSPHLEHVDQAHDRMSTLIDDLLTLAKEGERIRDRTPVALEAVATGCWQTVESDATTLSVEAEATVAADESRLRQLLENLFRNAADHAGADATVRVGDLEDGFYVEDDGPGIPPEDRDAVFELGYTETADGTGFGLTIVRQAVEAHGWSIRVVEGADGGARFEITDVDYAEKPASAR